MNRVEAIQCPPSETGTMAERLRWLAAEPYRVLFPVGAAWSVVGVFLWILYYAQVLPFYPGIVHARIMIEAFGGAFLMGFLGTAGPRMMSAPPLSRAEWAVLVIASVATGVLHLLQRTVWGDWCFGGMLACLGLGLVVRGVGWRREPVPPALLLAAAGLTAGCVGVALVTAPSLEEDPRAQILGRLLLYQGLLLAPVLGVGVFLFPRILGGRFGEARTARELWRQWGGALAAVLGLLVSFLLETEGHVGWGRGLRAAVCVMYLGTGVRWRRVPGTPPRGALTLGLLTALVLGASGLFLSATGHPQHVSILHLLYIGGFGLLMLVVGSRVVFGHSGEPGRFNERSRMAWALVGTGVVAALTRATVAWVPSITVSHHLYAAGLWALASAGWLAWHRRRLFKADPE